MNVEIIKGVKAINKAIVSIHTRGQSLQHDMHQVACSVLAHVAQNRDIQVAKKLLLAFIQAMPEMSRTNALRDWFNAFSTMQIGENDFISLPEGKKPKLADAMAKPFWKFSPEKPYQVVDFAAEVKRLINKLTTDATKAGTDYTKEIAALTTLASQRVAPSPVGASADPLAAAPKAVMLKDAKPGQIVPELAPIH